MNIEYSEICDEDIDMYAKLYQSVFAEEPWKEVFEIKKVKDYFLYCHRNSMFGGIAAKENNTLLCGLITFFLKPSAAGMTMYIDELMVHEQYRLKGIGSKLIEEVEKIAKEKKIVSIIVLTSSDSKAYNLYKKFDFCNDDSLVGFYKNIDD